MPTRLGRDAQIRPSYRMSLIVYPSDGTPSAPTLSLETLDNIRVVCLVKSNRLQIGAEVPMFGQPLLKSTPTRHGQDRHRMDASDENFR
jgi:hypothetical protein